MARSSWILEVGLQHCLVAHPVRLRLAAVCPLVSVSCPWPCLRAQPSARCTSPSERGTTSDVGPRQTAPSSLACTASAHYPCGPIAQPVHPPAANSPNSPNSPNVARAEHQNESRPQYDTVHPHLLSGIYLWGCGPLGGCNRPRRNVGLWKHSHLRSYSSCHSLRSTLHDVAAPPSCQNEMFLKARNTHSPGALSLRSAYAYAYVSPWLALLY
jgi:hypothetical protein